MMLDRDNIRELDLGILLNDHESSSMAESGFLALEEESYTAILRDGLALRVYPDTRPHNMKIAQIQKGLVMVLGEQELVEEGAGFGVPVAIFSDRTYFSSSAQVLIDESGQDRVIIKRFIMDAFSKREWRIKSIVDNRLYKSASNLLEEAYRRFPRSRKLILLLARLKNKAGIRTCFVKSHPRGEVSVTYRVKPHQLEVEADFSRLDKDGLKKTVMLNEQGSSFFERLVTSDGSDLADDAVGAWDQLSSSGASFTDLEGSLAFSLHNLPESRLFAGREYFKGSTAWSGLEYELESALEQFNYKIQFT